MEPRRFVILVAALTGVAFAVHVAGQAVGPGPGPQTPAIGTALVFGRVVDTDDKPIPAAIVSLYPTSGSPGVLQGGGQRLVADSDGRFVIRNLPAGRYEFGSGAPGFLGGSGYGQRRPGGPGQTLELADGQKVQNIILRLWRPAAISGVVSDEAGGPLADLDVVVLRRNRVASVERLVPARSARTDDRGVYRVHSLVPGDYIVGVRATQTTLPDSAAESAQGGGSVAAPSRQAPVGYRLENLTLVASGGPTGPPPAADGRIHAYTSTFFPNVSNAAQARVITLGSGEQRSNVDLQMTLAAMYRVTGRVIGVDAAPAGAEVKLTGAEVADTSAADVFVTATTRTMASGAFALLAVPPGHYVARVLVAPRPAPPPPGGVPQGPRPMPTEPILWATAPIVVAESDVAGVTLALQPGPRVMGRLEFQGAIASPPPQQLQRIMVGFDDGSQTSMYGGAPIAAVDERGALRSPSLAPGGYLVRVFGGLPGWSLKAAMLDGRDVSDEPFSLESADLTNLVVTMTDKPNLLSGVVRAAGAAGADRNALVLLFPAARERWTARNGRSMRTARVSTSGAYSLSSVPAGTYYVAGVDDQTASRWPDPAWLDLVAAQATLVTITDDERKVMDLRTVNLR